MITLASMLMSSMLLDDPRVRKPEFHLADAAESAKWASVARPSGLSNNVHGLMLTFKRTAFFNENDNHVVVISIRNHHGFLSEDTDNLTAGYDPFAGTPPEGTTDDWFHFTTNTNSYPPIDVVYCRPTPQSTELPAGHIWVVVREDATGAANNTRAIYKLRLDLRKRIVTGDAPVDSRLVYGEPNDEGWYANANGMLRYVNFNPWTYRGGMFVGNMPMATGDGSGKSRSQFWFDALSNDDETYLQFMNFSVAHVGAPPIPFANPPETLDPTGSVDIGMWPGTEQSGHTGILEDEATWENKWVLSGAAYSAVDLPAWTPGNSNYANFPLTKVVDAAKSHCTNAFQRLFLALIDESTFTDARWRYFISKESAHNGWPSNSGFYSQDLKPRQWAAVLGYGEYTSAALPQDARSQK